jgi:hypothetical protein
MVKIMYDAYTTSGDNVSTFINKLREPIQTQFKLSDEETAQEIEKIKAAIRALATSGDDDITKLENGFI